MNEKLYSHSATPICFELKSQERQKRAGVQIHQPVLTFVGSFVESCTTVPITVCHMMCSVSDVSGTKHRERKTEEKTLRDRSTR